MITLGKLGVQRFGPAMDISALRLKFDQQHYLRFPHFLDPEILGFAQSQIESGRFYQRVHENIGSNKELCMVGNAGFGALLLLVNDEKLFQIIQDVTQCAKIRCFEGRVYRVSAGQGHHDSWRDDIGDHRLVGMSVNLGKNVHVGGMLQIRERVSGKIVADVPNERAGDAEIFRLSDKLQHRITVVEGVEPKTAFAGWFRQTLIFFAC
jgi:hypothetical protein